MGNLEDLPVLQKVLMTIDIVKSNINSKMIEAPLATMHNYQNAMRHLSDAQASMNKAINSIVEAEMDD